MKYGRLILEFNFKHNPSLTVWRDDFVRNVKVKTIICDGLSVTVQHLVSVGF